MTGNMTWAQEAFPSVYAEAIRIGCEGPREPRPNALADVSGDTDQSLLRGRGDEPSVTGEECPTSQSAAAAGKGAVHSKQKPVIGPKRLMEPKRVIEAHVL